MFSVWCSWVDVWFWSFGVLVFWYLLIDVCYLGLVFKVYLLVLGVECLGLEALGVGSQERWEQYRPEVDMLGSRYTQVNFGECSVEGVGLRL